MASLLQWAGQQLNPFDGKGIVDFKKKKRPAPTPPRSVGSRSAPLPLITPGNSPNSRFSPPVEPLVRPPSPLDLQLEQSQQLQALTEQYRAGKIDKAQRVLAAQEVLDTKKKNPYSIGNIVAGMNDTAKHNKAAFTKAYGGTAKDIGAGMQSVPREIRSTSQTLDTTFTGKDQSQTQKNTGLDRLLFGEAPVTSYQKQSNDLSKAIEASNSEENPVLSKFKFANEGDALRKFGPLIMAGLTVSDYMTGGGKKAVISKLVKETTEEGVEKLATKAIGGQISKTGKKAIAKTKDPNVVDTILKKEATRLQKSGLASGVAPQVGKTNPVPNLERGTKSPVFEDYGSKNAGQYAADMKTWAKNQSGPAPKAPVESKGVRVTDTKKALAEGFMDIDTADPVAVRGVFDNAGYVDRGGYKVHPDVDPRWVDDLSPETRQLMADEGITYIDASPDQNASAMAVKKNLGGNEVKGISVNSKKDAGLFTNKDPIIAHEIGHHKWNQLSPAEKAEWGNRPAQSEYGKRIEAGHQHSGAMKGEEEFAEQFAAQHTGRYGGGGKPVAPVESKGVTPPKTTIGPKGVKPKVAEPTHPKPKMNPASARPKATVSKKAIEAIPFTNKKLIGVSQTPERVIRQMTKDPKGREVLTRAIVTATDKANNVKVAEVSKITEKTAKLMEDAGLTKRSLTGGMKTNKKTSAAFQDFVEAGGATSKKARQGLYRRVGKEKANKMISAEPAVRKQYDDLIKRLNAGRAKGDQIKYRKNYVTHLNDISFTDSTLNLADAAPNASNFANPVGKKTRFGNRRTTNSSNKDVPRAMDEYNRAALGEIYSKKPVKELENVIEVLKKRGDVPTQHINWLEQQVDILSGRGTKFDRSVEGLPGGAAAMKGISAISKHVNVNLIGANVGSVMTQPAQLVQSMSKFGPVSTLRAIARRVTPTGRALTKESAYLTARHTKLDKIAPGLVEKLVNASLKPIDVTQKSIDKIIYDAARHRAGKMGLKGKEALDWADAATKEVTGARGVGQTAHLYASRTGKTIVPFTLEMGNALHALAADELRGGRIGGILIYTVGAYGFNKAFEGLTGREGGVMFDPAQASVDTYENYKEGDTLGAVARIPGEIVANSPGGQLVAGTTKAVAPDFGKRVFDESGAGRYGIGVPAIEAGKTVVGALNGQGNPWDAAPYLAPAGGVPIKRSIEGGIAVAKGKAESKGKEVYKIEKTVGNFARGILFGKHTTKEGKAYGKEVSNYFKALDEAGRGLTDAEKNSLLDLVGSKKNRTTGQYEVFPTVWDSESKAVSLLKSEESNGRIIDRVTKMYADLEKTGQKVDPLWKQEKGKIIKTLQYQTFDAGGDQKKNWYNENKSWYQPMADERTKFFAKLPLNDPNKPKEPIPYPKAGKELQKKIDTFYTLSGEEKYNYTAANPDVQEQLDKQFKYTNDILMAKGGKGYKEYPKPAEAVQTFITTYSAGDKATRKELRNSNPQRYKEMIAFYDATNLWTIANESGKTQLKGQPNTTDKLLEKTKMLSNDIYENADGTYAIYPAGWMDGLDDGSGGFGKGYAKGGRRSGGSGGGSGGTGAITSAFSTANDAKIKRPKGVKVRKLASPQGRPIKKQSVKKLSSNYLTKKLR